jgi:hypothetical protein
MRAIFKSVWVRKLIGKLGVPYNRRMGVRDSSHPLNYDADLSLPAAVSNAFRVHSDFIIFERRIASLITLFSSWEILVNIRIPRTFAFGSFGLPIFGFIKYFLYSENNC